MKRKPCSCGTISSSSACRIRVCQNMKKETETKICNKSELLHYIWNLYFLGLPAVELTAAWDQTWKFSGFISQKCNGNSPTWNLCLPFLPVFPEELNLSTTRKGCEKSQRGSGGHFLAIFILEPLPPHPMSCPFPLLSDMFDKFSQLSLRWNRLAALEDRPEQGYHDTYEDLFWFVYKYLVKHIFNIIAFNVKN